MNPEDALAVLQDYLLSGGNLPDLPLLIAFCHLSEGRRTWLLELPEGGALYPVDVGLDSQLAPFITATYPPKRALPTGTQEQLREAGMILPKSAWKKANLRLIHLTEGTLFLFVAIFPGRRNRVGRSTSEGVADLTARLLCRIAKDTNCGVYLALIPGIQKSVQSASRLWIPATERGPADSERALLRALRAPPFSGAQVGKEPVPRYCPFCGKETLVHAPVPPSPAHLSQIIAGCDCNHAITYREIYL